MYKATIHPADRHHSNEQQDTPHVTRLKTTTSVAESSKSNLHQEIAYPALDDDLGSVSSAIYTIVELLSKKNIIACDAAIVADKEKTQRLLESKISKIDESENKLLTYEEAAKLLQISQRSLVSLVQNGSLEDGYHYVRLNSSVRFHHDIPDRVFLKSQATNTPKNPQQIAPPPRSKHEKKAAPAKSRRNSTIDLNF